MDILEVEEFDLSIILDLQRLCYYENAKRYNDFSIAPLIQTIDELRKEFTECVIFKVVVDNQLIGSIRAVEKDETCYIGRVIVHPDFQNMGIGKKLMDAIELKYSHIKRFELFTGFKDEKNLYFYNKLGYKQFKEIKIKKDFNMIFLEKII